MDLIYCLEQLSTADTTDELFCRFEKIMAELGFNRILMALMTDHVQLEQKAQHGILKNYPDYWVDYYLEKSYDAIDPVRLQAMQRVEAYTWDALINEMELSNKQQRMFNEAQEVKLLCGVGVPLRGPGGAVAAIGLASTDPGVDRDLRTMVTVQALSSQFYTRYWVLNEKCEFKRPIPELSEREKDVLRWLALGFSKRQASDRLNLSIHTVDYHVRSIFCKLNVSNITAAVYLAVSYGLLPYS